MTQADRDRLVALQKAKKRLITQREAAAELGLTERQVRRLLRKLKRQGDKAVIHGLRGQPSNRSRTEEERRQAVKILAQPVYRGFGPTLASEYLASQHAVQASRETVRKWMREAGLWRARTQRVEQVHVWRPRRSRFGEMVQWDSSLHDWLEARGPRLALIAMLDDATSRLLARFAEQDTSEQNMRLLERWLRQYGRMLSCYTDRASLFQTAVKTKREEQRQQKDQPEMAPTQIGRALQQLDITWIPAYSPQAKGRAERGFSTMQDRLVKGLRVAGASTLEQANEYLEKEFLPWWERTLTVAPANPSDAHRPLGPEHDLAAILSQVQTRRVTNDYTLRWEGQIYQIARGGIRPGLRNAVVQVEKRLDGTLATRFRQHYLQIRVCQPPSPVASLPQPVPAAPANPARKPGAHRAWMRQFWDKPGPPLWKALQESNAFS